MPAALLLTLMTTQANSAQLADPSSSATSEIGIAVHNRHGVPPEWLRQAQDEMTRIYGEIGVRIN